MSPEQLWAPSPIFGEPFKIGEWIYNGLPLAVRLFRSDVLYGSGDVYDPPEIQNDRAVECYYMELQVAGEDRWGVLKAFLTEADIDRFNRDQLNGTLEWR